MHCHKTGLGALCAHPKPRLRAHCAYSAHFVGAAARTGSRSRACHAHSQRRSRACWACTCRDTPRQPAPRSRPHFEVATSRQPESCRDIKSMSRHRGSQKHVVTSNRCHDTTQNTPGRNLKTGSRHQTSCRQSTQVATFISCRDLMLTRPGCDLKSCRDLESFSLGHHMNFMYLGSFSLNLSQVATPKGCRDTNSSSPVFALHQNFLFFLKTSSSFPATPRMQ